MYYKNSILVLSIRKEEIKMSLKKEIKKVEKLINEKGYIPFMDGYKILFIARDNKTYYPVNNLIIKEVK